MFWLACRVDAGAGKLSHRSARMPAPANYASLADVKWEVAMPVYEYVCKDCHKEFEQVLTLTEHDAEKIVCPKCGSKNVEQEAAGFFAVTSKKS